MAALDRLTTGYSRLVQSDAPAAQRARSLLRTGALQAARATYGSPRPVLPIREDLPALLNRRRLLGTGYEIGVRHGEFSALLLDGWRGARLVSIDPWAEAPPEEYVDLVNVEQTTQDERYELTRSRLARFGERSEVRREFSVEAAQAVADRSADFAYIDARHDHDSVVEDLEAWWPKIRPGGVIAGHDYVDGTFEDGIFGVRSAVDGFFGRKSIHVGHTRLDPPWPTWCALRPGA